MKPVLKAFLLLLGLAVVVGVIGLWYTLNEKTKILRGKVRVNVEELKPGERVVVTATQTKGKDGKTTMVATEIRLGTVNAIASK